MNSRVRYGKNDSKRIGILESNNLGSEKMGKRKTGQVNGRGSAGGIEMKCSGCGKKIDEDGRKWRGWNMYCSTCAYNGQRGGE